MNYFTDKIYYERGWKQKCILFYLKTYELKVLIKKYYERGIKTNLYYLSKNRFRHNAPARKSISVPAKVVPTYSSTYANAFKLHQDCSDIEIISVESDYVNAYGSQLLRTQRNCEKRRATIDKMLYLGPTVTNQSFLAAWYKTQSLVLQVTCILLKLVSMF